MNTDPESKPAPRCSNCGRPLSPESPGGFCAICMLEGALALGAAPERPTAAEPPGAGEAVDGAASSGAVELPQPPPRFGDYELLEEIGRGGMGVVYKARQLSLDRFIALKTILFGPLATPEQIRRFRTEASAAAALQHPNIVAVHEVGVHQNQHYLVMDLVDGPNLGRLLKDNPLPARQAATYLKAVAEAIHFAHERGILHRDLKPSNVLVGSDDRPRVADFGLARRLGTDSSLTLAGQMLGSPNYMPPEQAAGGGGKVGRPADVYGLGAILYHLLTARPPFQAETIPQTIQLVTGAEPLSPRVLVPSVPRDLETLCLKCLEKDPAKRYATAQGLAEELDRYLKGEPIHARHVGAVGKAWRWCRRKPLMSSLMSAIVLLVMVVAVGTPLVLWRIGRERDTAVAALRRVEDRQIYDWIEGDSTAEAVAMLAHRLRVCPSDAPSAEWLLNILTYRDFALPMCPPLELADRVFGVQFSPDGRWLLTTSRDNAARLWDPWSGRLLAPALQHDRGVVRSGEFLGPIRPLWACFSPDGKRVATVSADHRGRVWDAATGEAVTPWLEHPAELNAVVFHPAGDRLATAGEDGAVRLWSVPEGDLVEVILAHTQEVHSIGFDPAGSRLVTAASDGTARVWQLGSPPQAGPVLTQTKVVRVATFSPDGSRIATGSSDYTLQLWDSETGAKIGPPLVHQGVVNSARFSPDGGLLVTASFDQTARIWSVLTGQPVGNPLRHHATVRSALFTPEGGRVITASEDLTARVWNARTSEPLSEPIRLNGAVWDVAISPDGVWLATASTDGAVQLWDIRSGRAEPETLRVGTKVDGTSWSADGRTLLMQAQSVSVLRWKDNGLRAEHKLRLGSRAVHAAMSPDGRRVATACENQVVCLWDPEQANRPLFSLQHTQRVYRVRFDSGARRLVTVSADGGARVWEVGSGKPALPPLVHPDAVFDAAFSPDSGELATAGADRTIRRWDAQTGQVLGKPLGHPEEVVGVYYSRDGRHLVGRCRVAGAYLWARDEPGRGSARLGPATQVNDVAFSPTGFWVATASQEGVVQLWDARTGQRFGPALTQRSPVSVITFSSDGQRLFAAGEDGAVRTYEVPSGQHVGLSIPHPRKVNTLAVSPDGRWLATGCSDWTLRVWELTPRCSVAPDWLPDLAESVVGRRFIGATGGTTLPLVDRFAARQRYAHHDGSDPLNPWVQWFFADRVSRPVFPGAASTHDYLLRTHLNASHWSHDRDVEDGLLWALRIRPTQIYVTASLARVLIARGTDSGPDALMRADWLSRRAITLSPRAPDGYWARALVLEQAGDLTGALEQVQRATSLGPRDFYIWLEQGRLLESHGDLPAAATAYDRAVELIESTDQLEWKKEHFRQRQSQFRKRHPELP